MIRDKFCQSQNFHLYIYIFIYVICCIYDYHIYYILYIYDLYIYIQAFWVLIFEEKFRLPFFFGEFKTRSRSRNFIISTVSRFY